MAANPRQPSNPDDLMANLWGTPKGRATTPAPASPAARPATPAGPPAGAAPVLVRCQCGASYPLKEEFAGRTVKCPQCGAILQAEASAAAATGAPADPAFDRDIFLLRQKHMAISEKYYVWDEQGRTLLYVERPRHLLRNLFALLVGLGAGLVAGIVFGMLAAVVPAGALTVLFVMLAVAGGLAVAVVVATLLSRKRHVTFYRDDTKKERLLEVLQDQKLWLIRANYTVRDDKGQRLARFCKNYLHNIVRKRWYCYAPDGALQFLAKEDSIILSLLRRFLGTLFGLLRTNFILVRPGTEDTLGEFKRKFTIRDRYVLDMTPDARRQIDRRVAIALGVMLDTGERR